MSIITAADVVDDGFCCPLIGVYPCESERRGCYCHELHLINVRYAEGRAANITEAAAFLDRHADMISKYNVGRFTGPLAKELIVAEAECRAMVKKLRGET